MLSLYSDDETHEVLIVKKQQITKFNRHPYLIIYNIYYHTIFNCTSNFNYNFDIYTYAHIYVYIRKYTIRKKWPLVLVLLYHCCITVFCQRPENIFEPNLGQSDSYIIYITCGSLATLTDSRPLSGFFLIEDQCNE